MWWLINGDSRDVLRGMATASVDSVVCDPPYEIGFMGKRWDSSGIAYDADLWREVLRVLKPGGHLLAFGGTRTYHRMTCAIEDAGFEIRDSIHWIYGSGFPKSLDVSKAIDKASGIWRGKAGARAQDDSLRSFGQHYEPTDKGDPITESARQWSGWGTALKPAHEPCVVARKPLDGTVAANVLAHGVGAMNVDGCRIPHASADDLAKHAASVAAIKARGGSMGNSWCNRSDLAGANDVSADGRWPANIIFDEDAARELDEQSGDRPSTPYRANAVKGSVLPLVARTAGGYSDNGGASRFFYCAKASREDRDQGLRDAGIGALRDAGRPSHPRLNFHPTVKPTSLMRWLVRLVTPPGGLVLDPFAGSGSTGVAAMREGFRFAGIEMDASHCDIAAARIVHAETKYALDKAAQCETDIGSASQLPLL